MAILEWIIDLVSGVVELRQWWAEWRRGWNPVAFWLAVMTVIGILFSLAVLVVRQ